METCVFPKQQYYDVFSEIRYNYAVLLGCREFAKSTNGTVNSFIPPTTREPPAQNDGNNSVFVRKTRRLIVIDSVGIYLYSTQINYLDKYLLKYLSLSSCILASYFNYCLRQNNTGLDMILYFSFCLF